METLFSGAFLLVLALVLVLNLFSLPANWLVLALALLWRLLSPFPGAMDLEFFLWLGALAALGEGVEFLAQAWGAKSYGASNRGMWAGLLGAIAGALLGMSFLLGLGALVGAFIGAWLACYFYEKHRGRSEEEARRAAFGAVLGRFCGVVSKCAVGIAMFALIVRAV